MAEQPAAADRGGVKPERIEFRRVAPKTVIRWEERRSQLLSGAVVKVAGEGGHARAGYPHAAICGLQGRFRVQRPWFARARFASTMSAHAGKVV